MKKRDIVENTLLLIVGIGYEILAVFVPNSIVEFVFIVIGAITLFYAGFSFAQSRRALDRHPP